jgi:hypothetical protein
LLVFWSRRSLGHRFEIPLSPTPRLLEASGIWQSLPLIGAKDLGVFNIAGALPFSLAPAIAPAILVIGGGSYGVLYAVAGLCAIIGAFAILPVRRVR